MDEQIYSRFIELTELFKGDKITLQKRRGFTDDTIKDLCFRSGNKNLIEPAMEILQKEFPFEQLVESGLLMDDNGKAIINKQLLEGRILIPYLDENKKVSHIRPHKLGFKEKKIQVYCRYLLKDTPSYVVLTEGEFKAVALFQLGIPAISIPGVASFVGEHFNRLVDLFKEFEVKKVTILFDNEEKADSNLPNFKPDHRKRYDTDFWAYIMAYKLGKIDGLEANIAKLPDDWRIDGKADCDRALASGHTLEEFQEILDKAVNCYQYVGNLSEEAQSVVRRKIDRYFYHSPLKIGFTADSHNCYVWETVKVDGKGKVKKESQVISTFHLQVDYTLQTSNGCLRRGYVINRYNEKSEKFFMQPAAMVSSQNFSEFALSQGNYLWMGATQQLKEVWRYTFVHDDGAIVYQPDGYGLNEHGVWQFGNVAIDATGRVILPDEEEIFWLDEHRLGFARPQQTDTITDGKRRSRDEKLDIPILVQGELLDVRKMLYLLRNSIDNAGGYGAWLAIGWIVASFFSDKIISAYHIFPIYFIGGKMGSGKTSLGRWLMSLAGNPQKKGKSVATTSDKGLYRMLARYSNLPVWLDDFRNTAPESRIETFRNIYDRVSYERAVFSNDYRTLSTPVRATLLMDGEETPRDQALHSRCIITLLSEHTRGSKELYKELEDMSPQFSNFGFRILRKQEAIAAEMLDLIPLIHAKIASSTSDVRLSLNYAIAAAGFCAMISAFDITLNNDDANKFLQWVIDDAIRNRELKLSEDVITRFFDTLNILATKEIVQNNRHFKVEKEKLYLWFSGAFAEYEADERRRGHSVFKQSVILDYLKAEPYVIEYSSVTRIGDKPQRCIVIDLLKAPEIVNTFATVPEIEV